MNRSFLYFCISIFILNTVSANEVTVSCTGWCYLAQNSSNLSLLQFDNNYSNDTVHGWFNATSQQRETHRTGYRFNENKSVLLMQGYFVFFNYSQNVSVNVSSTTTIALKSGWNLVANMNASARNISTLKMSVTNVTLIHYYNRTSKIFESDNSTSVPAGEAFYTYLSQNTNWTG